MAKTKTEPRTIRYSNGHPCPDFGPGLGHWQDLTDDGYRRMVRKYTRALEDIAACDDPGISERMARVWLNRYQRIVDVRAALAECWMALDFGSESTADFEMDPTTGKRTALTDKGPSYGLAALFDWERHLRGESTVLAWAKSDTVAA